MKADRDWSLEFAAVDRLLKAAVILAAIYLFITIAMAFLPGGAVERVLGGGRW
jgi:hypothetical protein